MHSDIILWLYIILLVVGGIMGFVKAKSRVSLIMALVFGVLLTLIAMRQLHVDYLEDILLVVLLIVFGIRLAKTKKFMPGGLMLIATVVVLVDHHLR